MAMHDPYDIPAPAYWAAYLINGDCTHMTDAEIKHCDDFFAGLTVTGIVEEEAWFGTFDQIGHDMLTYRCIAVTP